MKPGKYTIEATDLEGLVGATMDVDQSGVNGTFTFPDSPDTYPMKFSGEDQFVVDRPGGPWSFEVLVNFTDVKTLRTKADGTVSSAAQEEGEFTASSSTSTVEEASAKAATEG